MNKTCILLIFSLSFALLHDSQRVQAASVDTYDTVPGESLTIDFGAIDASSTDYHLSSDATVAWEADPGSWELTVYYDGPADQVQVTSGPNSGALLSVAIGFALDDTAASLDPPTDLNFSNNSDATYRIIHIGSVQRVILADGTSVFDSGPNIGERKFADIGSRPFVLAASTKGGALNGDYSGTLTFDLDNGL